MSESSSSAVTPALASTLLLVRDHPAFQVLMVERHPDNAFGPGALVFPGGKLDAQDHAPDWSSRALGWDALEAETRALRVCAVRETFEETGVLLARAARAGVGEWRIGPGPAALREAVCRRELAFRDLIDRFALTLDLHALTPFARWITPEGLPIRFDASFFIATAPDDQLAASDGFETISAEWIEPARAVELAELGQRKLMTPTLRNLQLLDQSGSADEAIAAARVRPVSTVQPRFGTGAGQPVGARGREA